MENQPGYKRVEKKWRKTKVLAALLQSDEHLIDLENLRDSHRNLVQQVGSFQFSEHDQVRPVLSFAKFGECHDGFFMIPGVLSAKSQLQFARSALTEWIEPPHLTNMHLQQQQVSNLWQKAQHIEPALLKKLHWGAMGYHYDWTLRKYYEDDFSEVPSLLQSFGSRCAKACGFELASEAVIVNFYHDTSSMGGHQDDVEYTFDYPVVSLSLGRECIFLKGSTSKQDEPLAVRLRSGDVVIFGGKSRLSFHGVARILPVHQDKINPQDVNSTEPTEKNEEELEKEDKAVLKYLEGFRINVNLRQVYGKKESNADNHEPTTPIDKKRKLDTIDPEDS